MMNTKMTVAEKFAMVVVFLQENGADEAMVSFVEDRAVKATRKSTSERKVSDETLALRAEIIRVLSEATAPMSISEMQKASEKLAPLSTSKISGNITPILQNGKNPNPTGVLYRTMDKKVAKFSIAEDMQIEE